MGRNNGIENDNRNWDVVLIDWLVDRELIRKLFSEILKYTPRFNQLLCMYSDPLLLEDSSVE